MAMCPDEECPFRWCHWLCRWSHWHGVVVPPFLLVIASLFLSSITSHPSPVACPSISLLPPSPCSPPSFLTAPLSPCSPPFPYFPPPSTYFFSPLSFSFLNLITYFAPRLEDSTWYPQVSLKDKLHYPEFVFTTANPLALASAHSKSILTFPNNLYRHTCYYLSSVKQFQ